MIALILITAILSLIAFILWISLEYVKYVDSQKIIANKDKNPFGPLYGEIVSCPACGARRKYGETFFGDDELIAGPGRPKATGTGLLQHKCITCKTRFYSKPLAKA